MSLPAPAKDESSTNTCADGLITVAAAQVSPESGATRVAVADAFPGVKKLAAKKAITTSDKPSDKRNRFDWRVRIRFDFIVTSLHHRSSPMTCSGTQPSK